MWKRTGLKYTTGILCGIAILLGIALLFRVSYKEISDNEVPLGLLPEDDSFLPDMADYALWESGEYDPTTGEKRIHRRRMRTPEPVIRNYMQYRVELSEGIRLTFFEYDAQMNYLGCTTLSDGEYFMPGETACCFTITLSRSYAEKSLSPGQWKKLFSEGMVLRVLHGTEVFSKEADQRLSKDIFLLDLSFLDVWESGDYDLEDGTAVKNKRRLRYPVYIEREYDSYRIELPDSLTLTVFEFDGASDYLGSQTCKDGESYDPKPETTRFTVSLRRDYLEKNMSPGQWNAFFQNAVTIRISHGEVSVFAIDEEEVLCTTSNGITSGEKLARALLNHDSESVADGLWHNLILNQAYHLQGKELNNGNLTIYVSSSEGSDDNHGLSPLYPKASLDAYSGRSNINILLKCGDTFSMSDTFVVGSNSVYAAYGEGKRPVLNYYRKLSLVFEEVEGYENIWVADLSMLDICTQEKSKNNCNMGQLVLDGEVNWKRKVGSTEDSFDPFCLSQTADGGWAADWNTNRLYLYSEGDPNTCDISYAPPLHAISMNKVKNCVLKGIEITGAGMHGISMKNVENVEVSGCYLHHIGGSVLVSAGVRYGNAVQLWDSGSNVIVSHNYADWIFDTCYTHQGTADSGQLQTVLFTRNIGAHSFWGIEVWGNAYSSLPSSEVAYSYNLIYDMVDITNPETPMYSNKSGKVIFADPDRKKEDYVSYRCGYTYNQMSSVNVNNAGTGETTKIHDNIFWNSNRFLAIVANDRQEAAFSCLYDNLFYGETDVEAPALFRYTVGGGEKIYLESPEGYLDSSNRCSIRTGGKTGDNAEERKELAGLLDVISGIMRQED